MEKMLLWLKDIPQSVSVLGRQQMRDQNLNTVDDALKQVPGVALLHNLVIGHREAFYVFFLLCYGMS
ncbi:TonB-dependent receptor plug domain-containing protein [Gluconobacter aidae]|uniref:TonB-dependent receptor plug domain-containing protein n=1 Tax=Gluconobacter aidae TaxID=2662454 RepID=A0A7X1SSN9_9PROT|nr:TonB-dependent receptor plug domain-containing protein [Gluconobacter aidae]MQR99759.1 TonB-dependent receptor plug domain-containing protein [Gluconobacter aidae]